MPGRYMSDIEKSRVLTLTEENVSLVEIARRTGRGIATVKRIKAAAAADPSLDIPPRKQKSGRPRKTTNQLIK
jgi:transposase